MLHEMRPCEHLNRQLNQLFPKNKVEKHDLWLKRAIREDIQTQTGQVIRKLEDGNYLIKIDRNSQKT